MKTYKKISIGLSLVVVVLSLSFAIIRPSLALADATAGDLGASIDTFSALDSATIKANLGSSGTYNFIDNNPYPQDSTFNFVPQPKTVDGLCDPGNVKDQNGVSGSIKYGVTLFPNPKNATGLKVDPISAEVKLGYTPAGALGCSAVLFKTMVSNPNGVAAATYEYSGNNIINAPGFTSANLKPVPSSNNVYAADTTAGTCGGGNLIVVSATNFNSGTRYDLTSNKNNGGPGTDAHTIPALSSVFPAGNCYLAQAPLAETIAGSPGGTAPGGTPAGGNTVADTSCEAQYTGAAHVLNWILCPILDGMDSIFNTINGQVEAQLNVCTGISSTTGSTCGNNLLTPQVKKSWAVFRDLATALLVIVMLIMVFSQAISFGPFDAYTVRKMLPKIVAAVILMQISWPLFKFFVDLSNDLGHGIQNLMLAPFGGTGQLQFDALIAAAGSFAPAVATVGLFTALAIGTVLSGITIMGVALLGVSAIASVIVGLLVLLFRQMLIIMSMILAPIALLAWILPGTQKYWKLWSDNFIKLLFMFPLIMAMIAAGKIFAKIGVDTGTGIFGVIIVFVGFLGPLWFLPKTFKWGGQVFAAAANGTMGATKNLRNSPGKYALSGAKTNREQRGFDRAERLANNRGRRFDSVFAGRFNRTLGQSALRNRFQDTLEKGRKAADEAAQRSTLGGPYERLDHPDKVGADILVAQGKLDTQFGTGMDGRHAATQRAALERLAKYGDWDAISAVRDGGYMGEEGERVWQDFVAKNISAIHQNTPHLSPQRTDLSVLGRREFSAVKDYEWEEYTRAAESGLTRNGTTGLPEPAGDQIGQRSRFIAQAKAMEADTQFMATVSQRGQEAIARVAALNNWSPNVSLEGGALHLPVQAFESTATPEERTEALQSINDHLFRLTPDGKPTNAAKSTRSELGRLLGSGTLPANAQTALENHLVDIRLQAASSPQAKEVYDDVVGNIEGELRNRDARIRAGVASEVRATPANVEAASNVVQGQVNETRTRMRSKGLDV